MKTKDISSVIPANADILSRIPIGGFIKQSLVDYHGNISSVIFTSGCNFRCIYCHNPGLVIPERIKENGLIDLSEIVLWIDKNRKLLDAVVITGGEPTIHNALPLLIRDFKTSGLKVKLDTNGTNPEMIEQLINENLLDYIAMDIKTIMQIEAYRKIAGENISAMHIDNIKRSIELLSTAGTLKSEFRLTLLDDYHTIDTIKEIAESLKGNLYLQNFRPVSGETNEKLKPFKGFEDLGKNKHLKGRIILR